MTVDASPDVRIYAVASAKELAAMGMVARRLADMIRPQGATQPTLAFDRSEGWTGLPGPGAIVLASMSVHHDEPMDDFAGLKATWLDRIAALDAIERRDIFLLTLFPSLTKAERRADPAQATLRLERIRRLNLLAIELSHETGVSILEVGRWFSAIGANLLQTDYRLDGLRAQRTLAEILLWTILNADLAERFVPPAQSDAAGKLDAIVRHLTQMDAAAS